VPYQILIATPHAAFGELLRISLEETGDYRVRLVQTGREVLASLSRLSFDLVMLDADLADVALVELASQVHALRGPRLMVVPPDNNIKHPMLAEIEIHGFVYRPFYTPDLLESVSELMRPTSMPARPPVAEPEAPPDWLRDAALTEQHVQNALVGCTAHLVVITRAGQVLSAFGSLDRPAAQEIATILLRSTPSGLKNDLARYFRLSNIPVDYILYARSLAGEARLALVYEVSTPLTRIRAQMNTIIKALAQPATAPVPVKDEPPVSNAFEWAVDSTGDGEGGISDTEMANLTAWLADMPSPDPELPPAESSLTADQSPSSPSAAELGWISPDAPAAPDATPDSPQMMVDTLPHVQDNLPVWTVAPETPLAGEVVAPVQPVDLPPGFASGMPDETAVDGSPLADVQPDWQAEADGLQPRLENSLFEEGIISTLEETAPRLTEPLSADMAIERVDPNAITRPIALRRTTSFSLLDTASPAFAALAYAACLIPRLPSHYLNGEIAAQLAVWLPEICLAFGWRLLGVQIRPDTCQWVVQLSPSVPPAQMIRAVRQILSQRLFDHYGSLALENPSGDFWAPGYLVISGTQMPSQNLVRMFVVQTRRQQGLQIN